MISVVKPWHRLPREVVDAPSIPGNIQGRFGRGSEQPDPAEDVPAHCRGWVRWPRKVPSNPEHAVML